MQNCMAIVFAGVLAAVAGFAAADEKAMKEHKERGVTPEMMNDKDKQVSA